MGFLSHRWPLILGSLLFLYSLFNTFCILLFGSATSLGWMSNSIGFVLGIALLLGRRNVAVILATFGFIGEVGWTIDFTVGVLFGKFPFGATMYAFAPDYPMWLFVGGLVHLLLAVTCVIVLYMWAKDWPRLVGGELIAVVAYVAYLVVAGLTISPEHNVNCLRQSCVSFIKTYDAHFVLFFIGYVLLTSAGLSLFILTRKWLARLK